MPLMYVTVLHGMSSFEYLCLNIAKIYFLILVKTLDHLKMPFKGAIPLLTVLVVGYILPVSEGTAEACPVSCKTCGSGGSSDGGLPTNSNGVCEHFCSIYGACGNGDAYRTGDDCRGCTVSGAETTTMTPNPEISTPASTKEPDTNPGIECCDYFNVNPDCFPFCEQLDIPANDTEDSRDMSCKTFSGVINECKSGSSSKLEFSIYPAPQVATAVVEPYNSTLCA